MTKEEILAKIEKLSPEQKDFVLREIKNSRAEKKKTRRAKKTSNKNQ